MNFSYLFLILEFLFLVVWMTLYPKQNKLQEWFAVGAIFAGLLTAIIHSDMLLVASFGFVAGYLAAINHYYKGLIGV